MAALMRELVAADTGRLPDRKADTVAGDTPAVRAMSPIRARLPSAAWCSRTSAGARPTVLSSRRGMPASMPGFGGLRCYLSGTPGRRTSPVHLPGAPGRCTWPAWPEHPSADGALRPSVDGALAEGHLDLSRAGGGADCEGDHLAGLVGQDGLGKRRCIGSSLAVYRSDDIAALQPRLGGRATGVNSRHHDAGGAARRGHDRPQAEREGEAERRREAKVPNLGAVDDLNPQPSLAPVHEAGDVLVRLDLCGDRPHRVGRDRKTKAGADRA